MTRTGVLLINTGTPARLDEDAIRDFLAAMLGDPMLISCPRFIWNRVLKYHILPRRPKRTIKSYARVWTDQGSLSSVVSRKQRAALAAEFARRDNSADEVLVHSAMRYGEPSIFSQLSEMAAANVQRVVIVPLYPQQVRVCTGTCLKEAHRCIEKLGEKGWAPDIVEVSHFYDQPAYQRALARAVESGWQYKPKSKLCISFHSTLVKDIEAGDPYHDQNLATARALAAALGVPDKDWQLSYQSRFDTRKWLGPQTEDMLQEWAHNGVKDVCVVCPGFVAENIESKVEAGEQLRDVFLALAGHDASYTYIPTLDDDPGLIEALADAVEQAVFQA